MEKWWKNSLDRPERCGRMIKEECKWFFLYVKTFSIFSPECIYPKSICIIGDNIPEKCPHCNKTVIIHEENYR